MMSVLEELGERFESLERDIKAATSAAEYKRRRAASLEKRCRLAEESISNLKSKDQAEGEFVWKLDSGRHHERGVVWYEINGSGGRYLYGAVVLVKLQLLMDRNALTFASTVPPGFGIDVYRGGGEQRNGMRYRKGRRN